MPHFGTAGRATARLGLAAMVTVAALFAATACSSSGGGSSNDSSGASTPTSGTSSSTTTSSSSTSGGTSAGVAAAQAAVAKYTQTPTRIGATVPLTSPAPKGKTVVFLQCELSQCKDIGDGISAAAKAVGWTYKTLTFDATNPATLVAVMKQALQYKPVIVSFTGLPYATWSSEVPEYTKAGVLIAPVDVGAVPTSTTIPANINGPSDISITGSIIADWIIADSNGKANILLWNAPDFAVLADIVTGFTKTITTDCPACKIKTLNSTIAQVDSGAVTPAIVHTLQANPTFKYAFVVAGGFAPGLPAALKTAGLNDIKITGTGASLENESDLASGTAAAFTGIPSHYAGWSVVDTALRSLEGMSILPNAGGQPVQLLLKSNVGTPTESMDRPADFEQQFKTLWKVG